MSNQVQASARVTLTLEIEVGSAWGSDCKLDQIYKQAAEESAQTVENMVNQYKLRARVVGTPKVEAILVRKP